MHLQKTIYFDKTWPILWYSGYFYFLFYGYRIKLSRLLFYLIRFSFSSWLPLICVLLTCYHMPMWPAWHKNPILGPLLLRCLVHMVSGLALAENLCPYRWGIVGAPIGLSRLWTLWQILRQPVGVLQFFTVMELPGPETNCRFVSIVMMVFWADLDFEAYLPSNISGKTHIPFGLKTWKTDRGTYELLNLRGESKSVLKLHLYPCWPLNCTCSGQTTKTTPYRIKN